MPDKIAETAKQVAEVLVKNHITFYEVSRVFRETERHLSLAVNPEVDPQPQKADPQNLKCP